MIIAFFQLKPTEYAFVLWQGTETTTKKKKKKPKKKKLWIVFRQSYCLLFRKRLREQKNTQKKTEKKEKKIPQSLNGRFEVLT